jgi:signal peptidase I
MSNVTEIKNSIPNESIWSFGTGVLLSILGLTWLLALIGIIPTNYDLLFFVLSVLFGFFWIIEKKVWHKYLKRDEEGEWIRPWWLYWTAGVFPMVLFVFILRGVFIEPFKVPSGSMIPTIMIGEFIITNKISYDLKIPVIEKSVFEINPIQRGDVVVFRYPQNPMVYYIKRFVGMPRDILEYRYKNKELIINGIEVSRVKISNFNAIGKNIVEYKENLLGVEHSIWIEPNSILFPDPNKVHFKLDTNCVYSTEKVICKIPKDNYFAMGDNRDNSEDSRYWGFVPKQNVIGKATVIVFSPVDIKRIGKLN